MKLDEIKSCFENSPTILNGDEINIFIDNLLSITDKEELSSTKYAELLLDLIFCLSDNYQQLDSKKSEKVFNWVVESWSDVEIAYFDILLSILANLSYPNTKDFIKEKIEKTNNSIAKDMLVDLLNELQ
ncbi:hypothetical protein [Spartinivicinus poritis]|uniref:Immunity protein 30 domain-containing protein n=1 Tax=Spartinivicinus poritis TaxID=2994640 RepID=A0ABT5UAZ7_9GAMM|nr:hypothetical protein [Spartinivicinus sp. A2-2]MDE1463156.1 hypothetical protein [Spartinivicinus sp. A2-2]